MTRMFALPFSPIFVRAHAPTNKSKDTNKMTGKNPVRRQHEFAPKDWSDVAV
jgi:hypothetical protein